MLRIELDWATELPEYGVQTDEGEATGIVLEPGQEHGPGGGNPTVVVFAVDGPTLWSWLASEYANDEDEASYLASEADDV